MTGHIGVRITPRQQWVMKALREGDAHGYEIFQRVERLSEGKVRLATGTFYPALEGLLFYGLVEPTERTDSDAPDRRYYRLTESGRRWELTI
jgi:PadR family transcriptional regulator PadR